MNSPIHPKTEKAVEIEPAGIAAGVRTEPLHSVACHYDGELVHSFVMSDRELMVMGGEPGGTRYGLFERLKRTRPDLDLTELARFSHVIQLGHG